MKHIPPVDLTRQYKLIQAEVNSEVLEILGSGHYIGGEAVVTFEQKFADYVGVAECVSCNSGTDALYLALKALDIGEGDEVITTPFSFFATAEVISRTGATPVFIDIDSNSFNLDLALVETAITPQTKAIIPVHLFGQPVNMTKLMAIAQAHNLAVIEDCAQATGATWKQAQIGSIGQVGCFSFFPTKNLGACGDGGAITTNDVSLAKRIRVLKEHGSPSRYRHDWIGINSRLDALQAVILQVKLRYLDHWNEQRQQAAQYYQELLHTVADLRLPQDILNGNSVWNQYTVCIEDRKTSKINRNSPDRGRRELIKEKLLAKGIISMIYYPIPLHLQPVYQDLGYQPGQLPIAEQAAQEVLSLPLFPGITEAEQEQVAFALKDCLTEVDL